VKGGHQILAILARRHDVRRARRPSRPRHPDHRRSPRAELSGETRDRALPLGRLAGHPVVRWYEPGDDWYWRYLDRLVFELEGAPAAPSHL